MDFWGAVIEEGKLLPLLSCLDNSHKYSSSTSGEVFLIAIVTYKSFAKKASIAAQFDLYAKIIFKLISS